MLIAVTSNVILPQQMTTFTIPKATCRRCGHVWTPTTASPAVCPACHSRHWLDEFPPQRGRPAEKEKWAWIPGFKHRYEVSTFGQVRSHARGSIPVILSTFPNTHGYMVVNLMDLSGKMLRLAVHRLVALTFMPDKFTLGTEVHHKDGNKGNPSLKNLQWILHSDHLRLEYQNRLALAIIAGEHSDQQPIPDTSKEECSADDSPTNKPD